MTLGLESYFRTQVESLEQVINEKTQNLRRLEAQRNTLNAQGTICFDVILVRLLKEELQLLQEPGSYVAEVVKVMGKNKVLVKINAEGKYLVDIDDSIDITTLKPNLRVALKPDGYTLFKVLPSKVDPLVSLMMVEKVPDSTYDMIGGLDQQIKEIKEVIELPVKHPELFEALGIQQPKGVLLYGPPGTGKTLLARAVAHHTDCRFIRVSGSELVQKFIGEGSRMVRELFVMAREHAPSIIFMDEIDSIGSARSDKGSDSEVQRTMLELLNQLDGFEPTQNIKVIMATNRIDILDAALLRPGRIDRKIEFPPPNEEKIAAKLTNASGAEVKGVCTEAGMFALRERRVHVTQEDFEMAVAKIMKKDSESNDLTSEVTIEAQIKTIEQDAIMAVMNKTERRQMLRSLAKRAEDVTDEDTSQAIVQHREEFIQYLWKRKVEKKRAIRQAILSGPRSIYRVGDIISEAGLDAIQLFMEHGKALITKHAVQHQVWESDDVPAYLESKISLMTPCENAPHIILDRKRLSLNVKPLLVGEEMQWGCVIGNTGPDSKRLLNKAAIRGTLSSMYQRLNANDKLKDLMNEKDDKNDDDVSYKNLIAQALDLCYPTHQLYAMMLAFPLTCGDILKKRLTELGFSVNVSGNLFDKRMAVDIVKTLTRRIDRDMRFYYEITFNDQSNWRVGYAIETKVEYKCAFKYPGCDEYSFGFGNGGKCYYNGQEYDYIESETNGFKVYGVILDLFAGSISLVIDGKIMPPAFGSGSLIFPSDIASKQRSLILSNPLVPMISLLGTLYIFLIHSFKGEVPSRFKFCRNRKR
ncbi:26S proteasome subunit P45 [Rozella allomycis CSF55]|uniref:26S proteasome regulatory subunit 8 homolog n=1 Tax=Rozella allomycis (strain CSF55) TaxID=988480 RepID=A0A4P9YK77_ROZAC|nr:26S proteasome subunit P45 [Rozella allomycis CSF55]